MALQKVERTVTIKNVIPREARKVLLPDNTVATSFSTTLREYDRRHHCYWTVLELPPPIGKLVIDARDFKQYLEGQNRSCEFSVANAKDNDKGGIDAIAVTENTIKAVNHGVEVASMVDPGQIGSTIKRCMVCSSPIIDTVPTLCSGCRRVNYCARTCQMVDWPNHRAFCRSVRDFQKALEEEEREAEAARAAAAAAAATAAAPPPSPESDGDNIMVTAPSSKKVTFAETDTTAAATATAPLFDSLADSRAEELLLRMFAPTSISMADRRQIDAEVDELEQMIRDAAVVAASRMQY